jgi:hypothetical protein
MAWALGHSPMATWLLARWAAYVGGGTTIV